MKIGKLICILASTVGLGGIVTAPLALAQTEMTQAWVTAEGGRLYDNWPKVTHQSLKGISTHPSYPAAGKQKGESTWRCKECHGWDYKGRDGAYGSGSHFTGIKGLRDMVGVPPEQIASILRDKTHAYTESMLSNRAVASLSLFVSQGQVDVEPVIDRSTKKANGDPKRGARFFQSICAVCHGFDGRQINFDTPQDPEYIGTVASKNPWEALHKLRNGQPGVPMPSLGVLAMQDLLDILAYAQTLPTK